MNKGKVIRNRRIRKLYKTGRYTYEYLADKYGVTRQRIEQIVNKKHKKPRDFGLTTEDLRKLGVVGNSIENKRLAFQIDIDDTVFVQTVLLNIAKKNSIINPIFDNLEKINISRVTGIDSGARDRFRELIRLRDNYTCQWCSIKWFPGRRRLDIHHIVGDKDDTRAVGGNSLEMITLCHKCHLDIDRHKMRGNRVGGFPQDDDL